jgi:Rad3-related DNA helicase
MTTVSEALRTTLAAQGRTARQGQLDAAQAIDSGSKHVALGCPTGVGKSAIAIAASAALGGGTIAVHSNGLVTQYAEEAPEWEAATGLTIRTLVGRGHYWCPKASLSLAGLTDAQKTHVTATGTFIGANLDPKVYKLHTVLAVSPAGEDESDESDDKKSPCDGCKFKDAGCPLWAARKSAAEADVVITNATMLGVALGGGAEWAKAIVKPVIVLDEAHADADPIAEVLGHQITIKTTRVVKYEEVELASQGRTEAVSVIVGWADDSHPYKSKARRFLAAMKIANKEGRPTNWSIDDNGSVKLTIPVDLSEVFAQHRVVAMSATLSQANVNQLGLDAMVQTFQGLDVSSSTVFIDNEAPAWGWVKTSPAKHAEWATYMATKLTNAFRNGGATLGLFVSRDDLHAVVAQLPADVKRATISYLGGTDRVAAIARYKSDPKNHMLVGCVAGAGTGVNLPGEMLRTVVISRVPQNAPKGSETAKWTEDTRAAVVQSVGRAHRFDGDWGHVHVVGGFGKRDDVVANLSDLGWVIK